MVLVVAVVDVVVVIVVDVGVVVAVADQGHKTKFVIRAAIKHGDCQNPSDAADDGGDGSCPHQ